jgi:putative salt-induced outer membrane protein YdiY
VLEVRTYVALAALVVFGQAVFADQVTLSNGDRLTGTILKSDDKALVLKTEFAGEVTVQWPAITEINSAQPLHVALKSGQTLVGGMKTADGQIEVEPANRQPVSVSKDAISSLRSESEEVAYEHSLHPRLLEGWVGSVDLGFALTRGNSETQNLNLAFIADRKTTRDHIALYTNSVFASNDEPGAVPGTTAESTQGGARYDRNFAARGFGFGAADFETDALQSLDLRSVFSGGLGWHAIKTSRTTLDFLGGLNYTREDYSSLQRDLVAITAGQELVRKFGAASVITEKLYLYPDLNQTGEYRAVFNLGTVTKLSKWLGWQNAFGDIYVTNPPAGKQRNDLQLTTGLNVAFTH